MVSARSPMAGDSLGVDEAAGGLLSLGMPGEVVVEGAGVACAGVGDGRATEIDGVATGALGAGVAQPARLARTPSSSRRLASLAVCIRSPEHDVVVMEDELPHVVLVVPVRPGTAAVAGRAVIKANIRSRRPVPDSTVAVGDDPVPAGGPGAGPVNEVVPEALARAVPPGLEVHDLRHPQGAVSYTHLRAHETRHDLVCRLLLEKKKKK